MSTPQKSKYAGSLDSYLIGNSPAMQRVRGELTSLLNSDRTVVIIGERGTEKELVAELLHYRGRNPENDCLQLHFSDISQSPYAQETQGNRKPDNTGIEASRRLNISYKALRSKLKKWEVKKPNPNEQVS